MSMPRQLEGRLALITGAGSGIGRGLCVEFAVEGAIVAAVDIMEENLIETIQQCGIYDESITIFILVFTF